MSTDFDAYEESDRKMYAEYAHWADINGRFSHWAKDGTYKHWMNNQTRQQDIWDKSEREHDVHKWRMKRWEEREKEDRIQRSKESRPWYEEEAYIHRVDQARTERIRRAHAKEEQTEREIHRRAHEKEEQMEWEIHAQKKKEQMLREQKQRKEVRARIASRV
jgi:hypothetical protein